jgi:NAD(P)-dependent dehydrogenase (short-subunit alcohol dehydrogenase family)
MNIERGQVAVVTGGASGIGLALAEAFARAGLSVVLADVEREALAHAEERIRTLGVPVLSVQTDVSQQASVERLAASTMARFGAVHIVCNNAGVGASGDPWLGSLGMWDWVMGVNFGGVLHGVRAFLPHLLANGEKGGHMVNTASIAGIYPVGSAPYNVSKHAVVALTESLSNYLVSSQAKVGVSCLCPGWVKTNIADSIRNWPAELGAAPVLMPLQQAMGQSTRTAIEAGAQPSLVADLVLQAIVEERFWIFPSPEFVEQAMARFQAIGAGSNPAPPKTLPGMAPKGDLVRSAEATRKNTETA